MTHFRVRWEKRGGHIRVRLFSANQAETTHGKNGDLCFTEAEWESFLRCFWHNEPDRVDVVPEDDEA